MKSALVTGGSRGIGRAICEKLSAESEYHILINYKSNSIAAEETLQLVEQNGGSGELIQFDVADANQVKLKLDEWQENNPGALCGCLRVIGMTLSIRVYMVFLMLQII